MLAGIPAKRPYGMLFSIITVELSASYRKVELRIYRSMNMPDGRWPDLINNELKGKQELIKRRSY